MSDKKKIHKPQPISGFPEYLPEVRMVELRWQDHIRRIFESYGFCPIETPAVEALEVLAAKGGDGAADVDKEVYVLERLHKEEGDKEARLALHFDQTVPLARYTAQHFNDLIFPFKRYQMQKVWRGERPQAGRFREFRQCDIDVINVDHLPLHFDAEMPAIIWEVLSTLPGMEKEKIQIRISNRKILIGLAQAFGINIPNVIAETLRVLDKLEKSGKLSVKETLVKYYETLELLIGNDVTDTLIDFVDIKTSNSKTLRKHVEAILKGHPGEGRDPSETQAQAEEWTPASAGVTNAIGAALLQEGLNELEFVMNQLAHLPDGAVVADLSIVRGLDYYTGTVYETVFVDDPGYGSICSGGRYDDLASSYINKKLPGVGISIGFSRLFDRLRLQGKLPAGPKSPAKVLVVLPEEAQREVMNAVAQTLRARGINTETAYGGKLKRQLAYAEKKGIPYVWFPADGQVKNMASGIQSDADPKSWKPDA